MTTINPSDCPPDQPYVGTFKGKRCTMMRSKYGGFRPWTVINSDGVWVSYTTDDQVSDLTPLVPAPTTTPRTASTVEDFQELPSGTVVVIDGDAYQHRSGVWWGADNSECDNSSYELSELVANYGPAQIVWTRGQAATPDVQPDDSEAADLHKPYRFGGRLTTTTKLTGWYPICDFLFGTPPEDPQPGYNAIEPPTDMYWALDVDLPLYDVDLPLYDVEENSDGTFNIRADGITFADLDHKAVADMARMFTGAWKTIHEQTRRRHELERETFAIEQRRDRLAAACGHPTNPAVLQALTILAGTPDALTEAASLDGADEYEEEGPIHDGD